MKYAKTFLSFIIKRKKIIRNSFFIFIGSTILAACSLWPSSRPPIPIDPQDQVRTYENPDKGITFYFPKSKLSCNKHADYTEVKNNKAAASIKDWVKGEYTAQHWWQSNYQLEKKSNALEAAFFDTCYAYGDGKLSETDYKKQYQRYDDIRAKLLEEGEVFDRSANIPISSFVDVPVFQKISQQYPAVPKRLSAIFLTPEIFYTKRDAILKIRNNNGRHVQNLTITTERVNLSGKNLKKPLEVDTYDNVTFKKLSYTMQGLNNDHPIERTQEVIDATKRGRLGRSVTIELPELAPDKRLTTEMEYELNATPGEEAYIFATANTILGDYKITVDIEPSLRTTICPIIKSLSFDEKPRVERKTDTIEATLSGPIFPGEGFSILWTNRNCN